MCPVFFIYKDSKKSATSVKVLHSSHILPVQAGFFPISAFRISELFRVFPDTGSVRVPERAFPWIHDTCAYFPFGRAYGAFWRVLPRVPTGSPVLAKRRLRGFRGPSRRIRKKKRGPTWMVDPRSFNCAMYAHRDTSVLWDSASSRPLPPGRRLFAIRCFMS